MEVDEPTCQAGPSQPSSQGELTSTVKQAASSNAGGKTRAYGSVKEDDVDESDSGGSQSGYDSDNESEDEEDVGPPDPLYDPEADDEDEKFVAAQRSGRESDAILNWWVACRTGQRCMCACCMRLRHCTSRTWALTAALLICHLSALELFLWVAEPSACAFVSLFLLLSMHVRSPGCFTTVCIDCQQVLQTCAAFAVLMSALL